MLEILLKLSISHSNVQVVLPSNRTTVYDSLEPPLNQVFIFSERISDLKIEELKELAKDFQGAVGVVLVDVYVILNSNNYYVYLLTCFFFFIWKNKEKSREG